MAPGFRARCPLGNVLNLVIPSDHADPGGARAALFRFGEPPATMLEISKRMLTHTLREPDPDDFATRHVLRKVGTPY